MPDAWQCTNCKREHTRRTTSRASARRAHLKKSYGITPEQAEALLQAQGRRCAVCDCETEFTDLGAGVRNHEAVIDHCHDTRRIRGILCSACNRGIGVFRDDPVRLRAAAVYLERTA